MRACYPSFGLKILNLIEVSSSATLKSKTESSTGHLIYKSILDY
jgi:hypothetical protein